MSNNLPIKPVLEHYGGRIPRNIDGWQKMKCPFHDDSHASAGVSVKEGIFVCHGCGMKGNAINLVMKEEGKPFREAVKIAERLTGESHKPLQQKYTSSRRLSTTSGSRRGNSTTSSIRRSR